MFTHDVTLVKAEKIAFVAVFSVRFEFWGSVLINSLAQL